MTKKIEQAQELAQPASHSQVVLLDERVNTRIALLEQNVDSKFDRVFEELKDINNNTTGVASISYVNKKCEATKEDILKEVNIMIKKSTKIDTIKVAAQAILLIFCTIALIAVAILQKGLVG